MTKTARRFYSLILSVIMLITVTSLLTLVPKLTQSYADETETFTPHTIDGFTGGQFGTSSTSYPANPDGFTGSKMDGTATSEIFASGIVDLHAPTLNAAINADTDTLRLRNNNYTFGRDLSVPRSLFGYGSEGTNNPADVNTTSLMINSPLEETFYSYQSNSLTLEPNKYYQFGAWVMTGDFSEGTRRGGAYIKIVGATPQDNVNLSFGPIDTSGIANRHGWVEYNFYIETSSFASSNVFVSLQLGDYIQTTNLIGEEVSGFDKAKGVAFFDNVTATCITKPMYEAVKNAEIANPTSTVIVESLREQNTTNLSNIDFESTDLGGTPINNFANTVVQRINVKNYDQIKNNYSLSSQDNPLSPLGSTNILMLRNYSTSFSGFKTPEFTVQRHNFYRLSVWYKVGDNTSGVTARVIHEYDPVWNNISNKYDYSEKTFDFSCSSTGELYHNNWAEAVFYIAGSSVGDKTVRLELMLGTSDSPASGVAFFDEISIVTLLPSQYASNSGNGTLVSFDDIDFASGNNPSIANGNFFLADQYTEYKYPLKPQSFNSYFAGSSELSRGGSVIRNDEGIITGIIPVDDEHFNANKQNYGDNSYTAVNPYGNLNLNRNILYLYSPRPTAYGYVSPEVSLATDSYVRIDVEMLADIISGEAGANLVLRSGSTVISEIKNITNSTMTTYSFYVEAGKTAQSLTVEIWLGQSDGKNNDTRLASGALYISHISSFSSTTEQYSASANNLNAARFSFKGMGFDAYSDEIADHSRPYLLTPYTWQVRTDTKNNINGALVSGGIVNGRNLNENSDLYTTLGFTHSDDANPYVLMLSNPAKSASYLKSVFTWSLSSEIAYYQVIVSIKTVGIPLQDSEHENTNIDYSEIGAQIKLSGTNTGVFKAINTERDKESNPKNDYQDYFFYIQTDNPIDIGFEFWIGDDAKSSLFTSGNLFIKSVAINEINETLFAEYTAPLDEEEDLEDDEKTIFNVIKIVTSEDTVDTETDTEDTDTDSSGFWQKFPWWGIPTILTALALFIAIGGVLWKNHGYKLIDKIRKLRKKQIGYDREKAVETIHARNVERIRREKLESLTGETDGEYDDDEIDFEDNSEPQKAEEADTDTDKDADKDAEDTNSDAETSESNESNDEDEDFNKFDE